jgi:hypothetical protein
LGRCKWWSYGNDIEWPGKIVLPKIVYILGKLCRR